MDYSEKWGTSIEEAVRLALEDLKLTRDDVDVIVLEEPSKGFFGIGSKLAKVRVVKRKQEEVKEQEPEKVVPEPVIKKEPLKKEYHKREERQHDSRKDFVKTKSYEEKNETRRLMIRQKPDDLQEVQEHAALTFLKEVTEKMGLALNIRVYVNDSNVYIDMEGKDSGPIIGKRGQTLDAIQYLTSLVVNKDQDKYIRVVVDAENYREKREKTLEQLANRLGDKVRRTGKSVRLEPMNPYERKVIHATLQNRNDIVTRSEGEEPYRRVIIELK